MNVTVRDVSPAGVLVEAHSPPPAGSRVQLRYDTDVIDASVVWEDGAWFGLRFDRPLTVGSLLEQGVPRVKVSAPRQYRRDMIENAGQP